MESMRWPGGEMTYVSQYMEGLMSKETMRHWTKMRGGLEAIGDGLGVVCGCWYPGDSRPNTKKFAYTWIACFHSSNIVSGLYDRYGTRSGPL